MIGTSCSASGVLTDVFGFGAVCFGADGFCGDEDHEDHDDQEAGFLPPLSVLILKKKEETYFLFIILRTDLNSNLTMWTRLLLEFWLAAVAS